MRNEKSRLHSKYQDKNNENTADNAHKHIDDEKNGWHSKQKINPYLYIIKCETNNNKNERGLFNSFYQSGTVCYCFYNCCYILQLCLLLNFSFDSLQFFVCLLLHSHTRSHTRCPWNFGYVSCIHSHFGAVSLFLFPVFFCCKCRSVYDVIWFLCRQLSHKQYHVESPLAPIKTKWTKN